MHRLERRRYRRRRGVPVVENQSPHQITHVLDRHVPHVGIAGDEHSKRGHGHPSDEAPAGELPPAKRRREHTEEKQGRDRADIKTGRHGQPSDEAPAGELPPRHRPVLQYPERDPQREERQQHEQRADHRRCGRGDGIELVDRERAENGQPPEAVGPEPAAERRNGGNHDAVEERQKDRERRLIRDAGQMMDGNGAQNDRAAGVAVGVRRVVLLGAARLDIPCLSRPERLVQDADVEKHESLAETGDEKRPGEEIARACRVYACRVYGCRVHGCRLHDAHHLTGNPVAERIRQKTAAGEDTPPAAAFASICSRLSLRLGRKQSFTNQTTAARRSAPNRHGCAGSASAYRRFPGSPDRRGRRRR